MLIVDAQVHIWSQGTPSGQHRQISSYTAEDCLKEMGEGGVAAAVLHPPRWDPNDVEFAAEAAHQYPKPAKPEPHRDFERAPPSAIRAIFG